MIYWDHPRGGQRKFNLYSFLMVFTSSENDASTGFVKTKRGGGEGCESQLPSALKRRIVGKMGKRGKIINRQKRKDFCCYFNLE